MNFPKPVVVDLGSRSYPIFVASGLLGQLATVAAESPSWQPTYDETVVVVTDENVATLYLSQVSDQLSDAFARVESFVVTPGEASKSVSQIEEIWNWMLATGADPPERNQSCVA